jgi:hypothetical protein
MVDSIYRSVSVRMIQWPVVTGLFRLYTLIESPFMVSDGLLVMFLLVVFTVLLIILVFT